jgi:RNA polymerase sigma factor (sigma-70 family)
MTPDSELLATFARTNSEDAFAELVRRHVYLVYSAALRQVGGDAHLAQDAAQSVFTDLARKAGSLARRQTLSGWLYTSAHFAAAKLVRTETRRREREEYFMRELTNQSSIGVSPAAPTPELEWQQLRPLLDAAMHELKKVDRTAIVLRYFENLPFVEIGAQLGLNENAARMRVERALEKLRATLAQRGLATTATLAAVISAHAVQVAPAGLAATLTTTAIVSGGVGSFTILKFMTAINLKLAVSALVVSGTATAFVLQHQAQEKLRTDNVALTQQLSQLQTNNKSLSNRLADAGDSKKFSTEQFNELMKLRGEVGLLRQQVGQVSKPQEDNRKPGISASKSQHSLLTNVPPLLFTREFKIDSEAFFNKLNTAFPAQSGESETARMLRLFNASGLQFSPGESIFVITNKILIRASKTKLDQIEQLVHVVNSNQ